MNWYFIANKKSAANMTEKVKRIYIKRKSDLQ